MENKGGKRIVVAVDGSGPSLEALRYGIDLAKRLDAKVVGLHVIQSDQKIGYWAFIDKHFEKELRAYAEKIKSESQEIAGNLGSDVQFETVEGIPYEEVARYLSNNPDVILLVMGTHGYSLPEKQLIGSTTDRVIREICKKGICVPITLVPCAKGTE